MDKYRYETCCVNAIGDDITAMVDVAREITLRTFRKHCDTREWEEHMGYSRRGRGGLPLSRDWHVSYHKSKYQGRPCYYARHSAIEHIFTRERIRPLDV